MCVYERASVCVCVCVCVVWGGGYEQITRHILLSLGTFREGKNLGGNEKKVKNRFRTCLSGMDAGISTTGMRVAGVPIGNNKWVQ